MRQPLPKSLTLPGVTIVRSKSPHNYEKSDWHLRKLDGFEVRANGAENRAAQVCEEILC